MEDNYCRMRQLPFNFHVAAVLSDIYENYFFFKLQQNFKESAKEIECLKLVTYFTNANKQLILLK